MNPGKYYQWTADSSCSSAYRALIFDGREAIIFMNNATDFSGAIKNDTYSPLVIVGHHYKSFLEVEAAITSYDRAFIQAQAGTIFGLQPLAPTTPVAASTYYTWRAGRNSTERVTQTHDGRTAVILEDHGYMDTEYHAAIDGDYLGLGYPTFAQAEDAIRAADKGATQKVLYPYWGGPKCECGAKKVGDPYHARWCPVYVDPMTPKEAKK